MQSQVLKSNMCAHAALRECEPWSVCELGVAGCSGAEWSRAEWSGAGFFQAGPCGLQALSSQQLISSRPISSPFSPPYQNLGCSNERPHSLLFIAHSESTRPVLPETSSFKVLEIQHIFTVYKLKEILHFDFCEVSASFSHSWSPVFSLINGNISCICCFFFQFFFCFACLFVHLTVTCGLGEKEISPRILCHMIDEAEHRFTSALVSR